LAGICDVDEHDVGGWDCAVWAQWVWRSTLLKLLAGYLALKKGTPSFSKRPLHAGDE